MSRPMRSSGQWHVLGPIYWSMFYLMRRCWPMSLESQMHALLLKLLENCVEKAWVFHWHLFVTQVQPSCAAYSGRFVRTETIAVSLTVVSCLLMFSGIGSLGKTSLVVEASWHLGFAICLPAPKVSDCPLDLTFLHVQYCSTGEKDCSGDTLQLCIFGVCCGQGSE